MNEHQIQQFVRQNFAKRFSGPQAFTDPLVQDALNLDDRQRDVVREANHQKVCKSPEEAARFLATERKRIFLVLTEKQYEQYLRYQGLMD